MPGFLLKPDLGTVTVRSTRASPQLLDVIVQAARPLRGTTPAATSIPDAAIHNMSGYGADNRPCADLVSVATEDLPAGTLLAMGGHHHTIAGVTAEFRAARAIASDTPAPYPALPIDDASPARG